MSDMINPCNQGCGFNTQAVCVSCGRTAMEVCEWPRMDEQERVEKSAFAQVRLGHTPTQGERKAV